MQLLVAFLQLLDSNPVPTGHAAQGKEVKDISASVTSLSTSKEPGRSQTETEAQGGAEPVASLAGVNRACSRPWALKRLQQSRQLQP